MIQRRSAPAGGGEGTSQDLATDLVLKTRALEAIGAVADALYENLDFDTLVDRALDELIRFMGVPTAVIYALDSERRMLQTVKLKGRGEELLDHTRELPLEGSFTGAALRDRRIIEVADVPHNTRLDPSIREHLAAANLNVIISVPLQHHGVTVGACNLLDISHRPLRSTERETLLMIARVVAMALTHARHLEHIRQTDEALRQANEALEARVLERTHELVETNDRLRREVEARRQAEAALRDSEARYRQLSITDGLTGLFNHRHFYTRLREELRRAERGGEPVSLLLLDVDNFKQFNDAHGHPAGDHVLVTLADVLKECIRANDLGFRYGGEEFAVLLPQCRADAAYAIADRLRGAFESTWHVVDESGGSYLSVSIGGAEYRPGEDLEALVSRGDRALYRAKAEGKNCVCVEEP